jgi:hypothetical protein
VKHNLDNVINIGKAVKKDTEIGGKGTKSMNKKSGVPSGVNQLKSIPK